MLSLHVLGNLNLLRVAPAAYEALELAVSPLCHHVGVGAEEGCHWVLLAGCLMIFKPWVVTEPLVTVWALNLKATFLTQVPL